MSLQPCGAMAASPALGADDGSATASPNSSAPAWMSFDGQPSGAWQSGKFYGQDGFPLPNASVTLVSGVPVAGAWLQRDLPLPVGGHPPDPPRERM